MDAETVPRGVRELTWWERLLAGVIGLGGMSAGGVAAFVSSNQAGSSALLLLSSVFFLLSVQGTPLRRADQGSIELERRERVEIVLEQAGELLDNAGAPVAQDFIDGAKVGSPDISAMPQLLALEDLIRHAEQYREDVSTALRPLIPHPFILPKTHDEDADLRVINRDEQEEFGLVLLYFAPGQKVGLDRLTRALERAAKRQAPTAIVTNSLEASRAASKLRMRYGIRVATWSEYSDGPNLERLLRDIDATLS